MLIFDALARLQSLQGHGYHLELLSDNIMNQVHSISEEELMGMKQGDQEVVSEGNQEEETRWRTSSAKRGGAPWLRIDYDVFVKSSAAPAGRSSLRPLPTRH